MPKTKIPAWQRERARRFARIAKSIHARVNRGEKLRSLLARPVWTWRGRFYKCDPARPTGFCRSTLLRLYYQWRDGGQNADALTMRYRCGRHRIKSAQLLEFIRAAVVPGIDSFSAAYRKLGSAAGTHHAYRHALPKPARETIAQLFTSRRKVARLESQARRHAAKF